MTTFRKLLAAATVTVGLTLTACGGDAAPGTDSPAPGDGGEALKVTVVTPYLANATTKEVIDDFQEVAEDRGWSINVVDTAGDFNKLNSAFQDAAAQSPDAIVLGMGDPTQVSLGLNAASTAEIPVFAIDAAPADGILANVTSDNIDLGTQSANALIGAIGGEGAVVMLTHDPHPGVRARAEGAKKVFEEKGITILEAKHIDVPGPVDNARAAVQDLLTARAAEVDGIWGGWDEPALGATQALDAAGNTEIPVVGVDGQDFAVAEIEKGGPFKATVKQDWPAIAEKVADLIQDKVVDGTDPAEGQIELPGTLVTGD